MITKTYIFVNLNLKNRFILRSIFSRCLILSFLLLYNLTSNAQYSEEKNEIFSFEKFKIRNTTILDEISICFIKKIEIKPTYSKSSFNWSIAGDKNKPNVLSEVIWKDLISFGAQSNFSINLNKEVRPLFSWIHLKIFNGESTDIDYTEDNRSGTNYYQKFESNTGYYSTFSIMHPVTKKNNILLGVATSFQNLNLFHDNINKSSYYKSFWFGVEGEFIYSIFNKQRFSIETHNNIRLSRYTAKADWILREDLKHPESFKHFTFIAEVQSSIQTILKLRNDYNVGGGCEFTFQKSLKGVDQLFFSNGTFALTKLNGINGNRMSFFLLINKNFKL